MASCIYIPCVEKSNGEVVESKVFRDLANYTSSREKALELYAIAKNPAIIEQFKDRVKLIDGEISFESLLKIPQFGLDIDNEKAKREINNELNKNVSTYSTAMQTIQNFMGNHPLRSKFIPSISFRGDKIHIECVERTQRAEENLNKQLGKYWVMERLLDILNKNNVGVSFLKGSNRYSTENVEKAVDGLYYLININPHGDYIPESLAEEAGHFAYAALGNNELIQRFNKVLTSDVVDAFVKQNPNKEMNGNPKRELAGYLIGKALMNNNQVPAKETDAVADKNTGSIIRRFVSRIISAAKDMFKGIGKKNLKDLKSKKDEAEKIANLIANSLLSSNFEGTLEEALKFEETRFDATIDKTFKKIKDSSDKALNALHTAALEFRGKGMDSKEIDIVVRDLLKLQENVAGAMAAAQQLVLMQNLISRINDWLYTIPSQMEKYTIAFANTNEYVDSVSAQENLLALNKVTQAAETLKMCEKIVDILDKLREDTLSYKSLAMMGRERMIGETPDEATEEHDNTFNSALKILSESIANMRKTLNHAKNGVDLARFNTALKFLIDVNGNKKTILHAAAKIFKTVEGKDGKEYHVLDNAAEYEESLEEVLSGMKPSEFLSWRQQLFSSASNLSALSGFIDTTIREAKRNANKRSNDLQFELIKLREDYFDAFHTYDTSILYETMKNPVTGVVEYTGNFKSEWNMGLWNREFEEFLQEQYKKFTEYYNGKNGHKHYKKMSDMERSTRFKEFRKDAAKEWRDARIVTDPFTGETTFHPRFENLEYKVWKRNLNAKQKNVLNRLLGSKFMGDSSVDIEGIKERIDALLPERITKPYRAPQFRDSLANRLRHAFNTKGLKGLSSMISDWVTEKAGVDFDGEEYGASATYFSMDNDGHYIKKSIGKHETVLDKIPLYGIKYLTKRSAINTDLFSSLLAYGSMGYQYDNLKAITSGVFSIRDVMEKNYSEYSPSLHSGSSAAQVRKNAINVIESTDKIIRKELFNVTTQTMLGKYLTNRKANKLISNAVGGICKGAALYFLGNNTPGAVVNIGTGFIEMAKEATAGSEYDVADFTKAIGTYFKFLPANMLGINSGGTHKYLGEATGGYGMKTDPLSLIVRHFDILSDRGAKNRQWRTDRNRFASAMEGLPLSMYSRGDHFMQTIPFLAVMHHIKVYDSKGKKKNLVDAYVGDSGMTWNTWSSDHSFNDIASQKFRFEKEPYFFTEKRGKEGEEDIKNKRRQFRELRNFYRSIEEYNRKVGEDLERVSKGEPSELTKDYKIDISSSLETVLNEMNIDIPEVDGLTLVQKQIYYNDYLSILSDKINSITWSEANETELVLKVRDLANNMHGLYDLLSKPLITTEMAGNMLYSMRGYAAGMVERRFAGKHYNVARGKDLEGSERAGAKSFYNTWDKYSWLRFISGGKEIEYYDENGDLKSGVGRGDFFYGTTKFLSHAYAMTLVGPLLSGTIASLSNGLSKIFPDTIEGTTHKLRADGFSDEQISSIYRLFADSIGIALLCMICVGTGYYLSDDEDKEIKDEKQMEAELEGNPWGLWKIIKKYSINGSNDDTLMSSVNYLAVRLLIEQVAFNMPNMNEYNSIFNLMPTAFAFLGDLATAGFMAASGDTYDADNKAFLDENEEMKTGIFGEKLGYSAGDNKGWFKMQQKLMDVFIPTHRLNRFLVAPGKSTEGFVFNYEEKSTSH